VAQIPIFVINMARDVERMASMRSQLDRLGLQFERIEAVDGRKISAVDKSILYSDFWFRFMHGSPATPGEIGVGLSHRKIYQRMIDEKIDAALILEDDTTILSVMPQLLAEIELSTSEFDMVQLFSFRQPDIDVRPARSKQFSIMRFSNLHASSAAYIMRKRGAEKLLRIKKVRTMSDRWCWLSAMSGLKCCAISPFPVQLHESLAEDSSVGRMNVETSPHRRTKSQVWRFLIFPWLNAVKLGILRVRGL
jgi:glycosyl transferase, family 25